MIGYFVNQNKYLISLSLLDKIIEDSKEYGLAKYMRVKDEDKYFLVYLYDEKELIAAYDVDRHRNAVAAIYHFDKYVDDWIYEIIL